MLKTKKRPYRVYRLEKVSGVSIAKFIASVGICVAMTSDRRDIDNDVKCVYLKKRYAAVADSHIIKDGDIIRDGDSFMRVISAVSYGNESYLHLESTEVFQGSAFEFEEA
ncbi:MAG: hypothetical protein J6B60_03225 [Clostridia bacterium]|nr:hypothetical protein [Clostridia bacterium]MBO5416049.1 hypothetical protein [Clostridia bacterium]